jgi:hypothetical protein
MSGMAGENILKQGHNLLQPKKVLHWLKSALGHLRNALYENSHYYYLLLLHRKLANKSGQKTFFGPETNDNSKYTFIYSTIICTNL